MGRFFNMDSPFFRTMSRVADLLILNVIFVVCCIPVVTIGPALAALFYMTMKMVRNEESYIIRGFFHSFKQNLKQGIIINLIMLAAGFLLWLDIRIVSTSLSGTMRSVMTILMLMMAFIYVMVFIYVYPVLAKFFNTIRNTFVNALLMAIRHLPQTIVMMVVSVLPVAVLFIPEPMATIQSVLLLLLILMGFSTIAYCNSFFLVKIFDNYIPKDGDSDDDSGADGALIEDSVMEAAVGGNALPDENTDQQESQGE